jgi:hypothetical protein
MNLLSILFPVPRKTAFSRAGVFSARSRLIADIACQIQ